MKALKYSLLPAVLVAAVILGVMGTSQPEPAQADPVAVVALNDGLCIALGTAFGGLPGTAALFGCNNMMAQDGFQVYGNCLKQTKEISCGTVPPPTRYDPSLFAPLDLDKNQIHAGQAYDIIAFVDDDFPVRFTTDVGEFLDPNNATVGQDLFCAPGSPQYPGASLDPDCDGDPATIGDGVVVAKLILTEADGDSGFVNVNVIQEGIGFPVQLTITGTPQEIELAFLFGKDTIQTGATPSTPTSSCGTDFDPGLCQEPDETDCNFAATVDGVLGTIAQAEKTIVVAKALDSNGVEVSGVLLDWNLAATLQEGPDFNTLTEPPDGTFALNQFKTGGVALPQTPTIDAQALGVGFPQFICGGDDTGTIDLEVTFGGTISSIYDRDEHTPISVKVIGPATDIALTAEPAEIDCTGTNTSTVTANVTNAEGDPVADGLDINFSVVALGTANPLATNSAAGVGSTVVAPLSGAGNVVADGGPRGVTVIATVKGDIDINDILTTDDPSEVVHQTHQEIRRSILVRCSGGPPPPGTDAGAGGAGTGGGQTGTIRPPDTGFQGAGASDLSLWTLVALATAGLGLAGAAAATRVRE